MAKKTRSRVQPKKTTRRAPSTSSPYPGPGLDLAGQRRVLNARPDGLDFRDQMYEPSLVEVPRCRELAEYQKAKVPLRDQGEEGACTGFGLATVAEYLLRTWGRAPDRSRVSPYMLYDMARRYDEWAGVDYEGSSCRGAMKGWHKHGVCAEPAWQFDAHKIGSLTSAIVHDAAARPLGAYYRVNHKDLVAMHCALSEVGVLYASARVHAGWDRVKKDGAIPFESTLLGGHAFAIVAYDEDGFWIQNSWGPGWGRRGFGRIGYADWLANGSDAWVARLGVPVHLAAAQESTSRAVGVVRSSAFAYADIRPHVVSLRNDGRFDEHGNVGSSPESVQAIFEQDFPRITKGWSKKRLVLYAHGGLTSAETGLQRVAEYRKAMLDAECYPLAFLWKSDYWTTLKNMLADATSRRRPEGFLDRSKDFMLDRLDDALEPIARIASGKSEWDEMKENAWRATATSAGGARFVADQLVELLRKHDVELHVVGHSAGSIFHAPLVQYLTTDGPVQLGVDASKLVPGLGLQIQTCTLWAPACTTQLFKQCYLPAIQAGGIQKICLFTLSDRAEQDDNCASIYHKSLLYLVSHAFEAKPRIPVIRPEGEPILGMERFIRKDSELELLLKGYNADWVIAPNNEKPGSLDASAATHHGDFDDDDATVRATLARILGTASLDGKLSFARSASASRDLRQCVDAATGPRRAP